MKGYREEERGNGRQAKIISFSPTEDARLSPSNPSLDPRFRFFLFFFKLGSKVERERGSSTSEQIGII